MGSKGNNGHDDQGGSKVLKEVVQLTGLPEDYLESEISSFLGTAGESVNNLSLDQLRSVLLNYLETLNATIEQEIASSQPLINQDNLTQPTIKH